MIALPILLLLCVAVLVIGLVVAAQLAVGGISQDAARVAVTASSGPHAVGLARQHARQHASGYGLDDARLSVAVDPAGFARGGVLTVTARYQLPLIPGGTLTVTAARQERIDPHNSRIP